MCIQNLEHTKGIWRSYACHSTLLSLFMYVCGPLITEYICMVHVYVHDVHMSGEGRKVTS